MPLDSYLWIHKDAAPELCDEKSLAGIDWAC